MRNRPWRRSGTAKDCPIANTDFDQFNLENVRALQSLELGNQIFCDMKEGERVRQAKQGVHGAAQGVGNRVPGQET